MNDTSNDPVALVFLLAEQDDLSEDLVRLVDYARRFGFEPEVVTVGEGDAIPQLLGRNEHALLVLFRTPMLARETVLEIQRSFLLHRGPTQLLRVDVLCPSTLHTIQRIEEDLRRLAKTRQRRGELSVALPWAAHASRSRPNAEVVEVVLADGAEIKERDTIAIGPAPSGPVGAPPANPEAAAPVPRRAADRPAPMWLALGAAVVLFGLYAQYSRPAREMATGPESVPPAPSVYDDVPAPDRFVLEPNDTSADLDLMLDPPVDSAAPAVEPVVDVAPSGLSFEGVVVTGSTRSRTGRGSQVNCKQVRADGRDALGHGSWNGVLRALEHRECWPSLDERVAMRTQALHGSRRWSACVATGRGSTDPRVQRWRATCERQLEEDPDV